MRGLADGERAAICSKPGDPTEGGWTAEPAGDVDRQCPAGRNNYLNCSSFSLEEDGDLLARKDRFGGFNFLMLDDVGTKVARERLADAHPTWEVETSPGNSQLGFRLDPPLRDLADVKRLQDAVMAAGLSDAGAGGVNRWARLPNAINGKAKYRDARGEPFRCRLLRWSPDRAFTVDGLAAALGIELRKPALPVVASAVSAPKPIGAATVSDGVWTPAPAENPVVTALRERGLLKREVAPGVHDVTCPWVREHTDAIDSGSAYFEPDADHAIGGYKCQHSHGDKYRIGQLLAFLGVEGEAARGRARIDVKPGELNRVRRAAELSLALRGGYYQMNGAVVAIHTDPFIGDVSNRSLDEPALSAILSDAADWYRFDGRSKQFVRTDPQPRVANALLKAGDYAFLPVLTGFARQPFFRDDGSFVAVPGYDAKSGKFAAFDPAKFPLPEPSEEAGRAALAELRALVAEFRFASPEDEAAALSAMLTAAVRPSLPLAPAFSITASTPGSGKSYLADVIAAFAGPGTPMKASFPATTEEATKMILSALLSSPAVLVFDDMQKDWQPFGALNKALTSPNVTDRLLATNKMSFVATRTLFMGTGNNIRPLRDMSRRVVTVRLHHGVEAPALQRYDGNPVAAIAANRGRYVTAALTIVRAWLAAGKPMTDLASIASYGAWSELCRQPLVWLGLPDPAASLIHQVSHDPDRGLLGRFLAAWHAAVDNQPLPLRDLLERSFGNGGEELLEAIQDLPVTDRDHLNRSKLGWYLKQNANRVVGGLELQRVDSATRTAWKVVKVEPAAG